MATNIINPLQPGAVLQGQSYRYVIERALGQGSFGITYLANTSVQVKGPLGNLDSNMCVAVKEFFMKELNGRSGTAVTTRLDNEAFVDYKQKFRSEALKLAQMRHPHIVKVLESFEANNTAYYVMEYIDGGTLNDRIVSAGRLSEDETLNGVRQITDALRYMHGRQMLHLDLKPSNIVRRTDGTLMLIDFGLSTHFYAEGVPVTCAGAPGYAPIEQANYQRKKGGAFPATMDVYALGATMFKMLVGKTPPPSDIIFNDGFPYASLAALPVSQKTVAVMVKAMSPLKKDRFQSVDEMMEALDIPIVQIDDETNPAGDQASSPLADKDDANGGDNGTVKLPPKPEPDPITEPDPKPEPDNRVTRKVLVLLAVCAVVFACLWLSDRCHRNTEQTAYPIEEPAMPEASYSNGVLRVGDVSYWMVHVEAGTFIMGATPEQQNSFSNEEPAHSVTLTNNYYLGETEVTQALWREVMGRNPSLFKGDDLPVENVSWDDCQEFIRRLNQKTGRQFRLPTEAEWEYAARGGSRSRGYQYAGSDNLDDVAWYGGNSGDKTHPVKTKRPNELGLYDMSGNVWEWCQDWYGDYSSASQTNPTGPANASFRVYRGGSWNAGARGCRVACRNFSTPDDRIAGLGLRLALSE